MKRITTAVRIEADLHEALVETADALDVSVNWLIVRLAREGLERVDLTLTRS